ncbi:MAG: hypothetical protein WCH93_08250 [Actinomycetota bacterium]|uniref:Unannotated protein n=1 Tax=freshwater metagenome TaxID=449393 RepID=A0A6J7N8J3_9ZZZZ|nr:hypothetical protein [Actinomycetota bacterium]MSX78692.1 hypothetical protein [Actinomycetota bacterium]
MTRRRPAPIVWLAVAAAVCSRPGLWPTAVRQTGRLARRGWWRRPPFLPLPGADYLRFRMETQYGDELHRPKPIDVIDYLTWCRQIERLGITPA